MSPPFTYRYLTDGTLHFAVVAHRDSPQWLRIVATFEDADRAKRYVECEQDWRQDCFAGHMGGELKDLVEAEEETAPAGLPAAPPTRVTPENFRPPSPAEKARVGAALIGEAAEETGVTAQIEVTARAALEKCDPSYPRPWAKQDDELRALWPQAEIDVPEIAKQLNRTPGAVYSRATFLKLGHRPRKSPTVEERRESQDRGADRQAPPVFRSAAVTKRPVPEIEPVPAGPRDLVRFLAKDCELSVIGPDDDQRYTVGHRGGLGADDLLLVANVWRRRRNEAPFQLATP